MAEAHHRPGHVLPRLPLLNEPLQVYDAIEQHLGHYTSLGCFIRQSEWHWVEVCALESQGNQELGLYFLLYSKLDCKGREYLTTWSDPNGEAP